MIFFLVLFWLLISMLIFDCVIILVCLSRCSISGLWVIIVWCQVLLVVGECCFNVLLMVLYKVFLLIGLVRKLNIFCWVVVMVLGIEL